METDFPQYVCTRLHPLSPSEKNAEGPYPAFLPPLVFDPKGCDTPPVSPTPGIFIPYRLEYPTFYTFLAIYMRGGIYRRPVYYITLPRHSHITTPTPPNDVASAVMSSQVIGEHSEAALPTSRDAELSSISSRHVLAPPLSADVPFSLRDLLSPPPLFPDDPLLRLFRGGTA
eukprot:755619-Hanusia_phi.AAC.1